MMRLSRSALALAALAAAFVSVAALAQPQASKPAPGALPATAHDTMEALDEKMDALSKQLGKPEALQTIWDIERLALHAKSLTPEHLKGGATPENLAGFRKAQIELMKLLLQTEGAIIDGKTADAQKSLDAIDELRKDSHRKYKAKKER